MTRIGLAYILMAFVLTGCATLNKDECMTADWAQIGYEDGARGYQDLRVSSHREACAKHGVSVDFRAYQDGYDEGVVRFCTPDNGFDQGVAGKQYNGVCPPALEPSFLEAFDAGREIHTAATMVRNLENEQVRLANDRELLKQQINDKTAVMLSDEATVEQRYQLNDDISDMQQKLGAIDEQERQTIEKLAGARIKLRALKAHYADY